MKQPVIVRKVSEDQILVSYPDPKSEKSSTSRSFWKVKERSFPASNAEHGLALQEGDMVEIAVDPKGAIGAAFMIFIFPLLCFLAVFFPVSRFTSIEGLQYLAGSGGLTAGLLANGLIRKIRGPGAMPSIERVLTPADIRKWKSCHSACQSCRGCG